jgi:ATP-dependent helicase HrpA
MTALADLEQRIDEAMPADRRRLRQLLRSVQGAQRAGKPFDRSLARLTTDLEQSIARRQARRGGVPKITYDDELPISARRVEIAQAIRDHAVVIVCGETGSGKSTQLPKICLELGRGIDGLIGHTQPRRIAARSVAARIAEELGSSLGADVGFKVRFTDTTSPRTYIKLMTDGILLAESQHDRFLDQYDTIILDEAHERSLNIDFLIGYLHRLLPRRRDLKLIVTSATIDAARFAQHFATSAGPAPVIEVSGRTYPVDIRYRPVEPDDDSPHPDWLRGTLSAIDEVGRIDHGDMLIFMPTERDIHETAKVLRGRPLPGDPTGRSTEILPLYARLSVAEQQRVFHPRGKRRIVIATNVAESSLTVPGIRFVIDPGTARISRYSSRSKMQRLPIEAVSRASADQRAGRCGRVGPGICIRLYDAEDYEQRERFTPPEIQRTNLASVILQAKALGLGELEDFPFLDPPRPETVRDGYRTLFELGAIDDAHELTELGRRLARLPVDPRIGRMVLAGVDEGRLHEVLIIAAALESQDPRDRPLDKQQAADECHAQFAHPDSDFLAYLKLWDFFHHLKETLSRSKLERACRQNFLSYVRMREWLDVHRQLLELVEEGGAGPHARAALKARRPAIDDNPAPVHRALLTGLLSSVAFRAEGNEYTVAGGVKANVWPGSGAFAGKPKWIMAAELVETTRKYLRTVARIDPDWIEPLAGHLVNRAFSDPHWDREAAAPFIHERVSLFGLVIVPRRRKRLGPIDPALARELFIRHALVAGEFDSRAACLAHNRALIEQMQSLEDKARRRDLLRDDDAQTDFYEARIPADVFDGQRFERWIKEAERGQPDLLRMSPADLLHEAEHGVQPEQFPDELRSGEMQLPLDYRYDPTAADDGVTLTVPIEALGQLDRQRLAWLVPGLLEDKIAALVKSLPKSIRTRFVPIPDTARRIAAEIPFGHGVLPAVVAAALTRLSGQPVAPGDFQEDKLPTHLRMNVRVVDAAGHEQAAGRDLAEVRKALGVEATAGLPAIDDARWNSDDLTRWDFGELPAQVELPRGGLTVPGFPALVDRGESVALRLLETAGRAERETRGGLRRLFLLAAGREIKPQVDHLPALGQARLQSAGLPDAGRLRDEVALLLVDRAFIGERPFPRDEDSFKRGLTEGRKRLAAAAQEVANLLGALLPAYQGARLAIERTTAATCRYARDDVQAQLDELTAAGFLTRTPWEWLTHVPRYLKAIQLRLEKLTTGRLAQDQRHQADLAPRVKSYRERAASNRELAIDDPHLDQYRWMLEEFRVSLFAQELGTSLTVSAKRLDKQWALVGTG